MLLIKPVSYRFETTLTPKKVSRKLDREIVEHRPTMNIMSNGRFMRKHRFETVFYGCRTSLYDFQIYHHMAKKRDGSSTGFFGKIEQTENGSMISGSFRKPLHTYIIAVLWTLVTLFLALMLLALGEKVGAAITLCLFAAGIFIMFWDNKKPYLRGYLDSFPRVQREEEEQI